MTARLSLYVEYNEREREREREIWFVMKLTKCAVIAVYSAAVNAHSSLVVLLVFIDTYIVLYYLYLYLYIQINVCKSMYSK